MGKLWKRVLPVFLAVLAYFFSDFIHLSGLTKELKPHSLEKCKKIEAPGLEGCEDIAIDQEEGVAFLACGNKENWFPPLCHTKGPVVNGKIFLYDLKKPAGESFYPLEIVDFPGEFVSHGISLYHHHPPPSSPSPSPSTYLFAVNHKSTGSVIEKFKVEKKEGGGGGGGKGGEGFRLRHLQTYQGEEIRNPNDVVAVGPDLVYFTNDYKFKCGDLGREVEGYLRLPISDIFVYDGVAKRATLVQSNFPHPNGINKNLNGTQIYVNRITYGKIYVYDRDPVTNALTFKEKISLNTVADNIDVDSTTGDLYLGCHPRVFDFLASTKNPKQVEAPSQVVKVHMNRWNDQGERLVEELFLSNKEKGSVSGSSVAASDSRRNRVLVGPVIDEGILDCSF